MNKRLEAHDRQFVELRSELKSEASGIRAEVKAELAQLRAEMQMGFGSLKASIEARDFRLDEHGRRLSELESRERP